MSQIIRAIFANFTYKLIAVLLAIIFWYIVQSEQVLEVNRKMRVQLIAPEGFVVKGGNIQYKDATLRGPRALLNHFSMEPIQAHVKLFTDKPQTVRVRIDKEYIRGWNDRIKITIYDAYISVFVDKKMEKELPIKQNFTGIPRDGYIIEKTIIIPDKVLVSAAASDLQRVDAISTEPIDINNISESKSFDSTYLLTDQTLKVSTKKVQVNVLVGEKKVNKSFANVMIDVDNTNFSFKIRPTRVSVVIQGSPSKLGSIRDGEIRAFLNINDLAAGIYEQKIQVKIPQDTVLIETNPENAIVEIYSKKKNL